MIWTLESWSDLLGLLSGIALVITAFRNDGLNGFVDRLKSTVQTAKKNANVDEMGQAVVSGLEEELTNWTWVDRWSLRVGAILLVMAYFLKIVHQYLT
ncbi:MAG: hypothetical protein ABJA49_08340 [Betaproteobacteria bacterium]